ncbi:hypothetical protein C8R47DRAFT_1069651 [Mycena vitilis]|nr:hypothetical protein C8R47DRAFT_1069651 [Mycena vitilis]
MTCFVRKRRSLIWRADSVEQSEETEVGGDVKVSDEEEEEGGGETFMAIYGKRKKTQLFLDLYSRTVFSTLDATNTVLDFLKEDVDGTDRRHVLATAPEHPARDELWGLFKQQYRDNLPPTATCETLALSAASAFPEATPRFLRVQDGSHVLVLIENTVFDSTFSTCVPINFNHFVSRSHQNKCGFKVRTYDKPPRPSVYLSHPTIIFPSPQSQPCYFPKRQEPVAGIKRRRAFEVVDISKQEARRGPYQILRGKHTNNSRGIHIAIVQTFQATEQITLTSGRMLAPHDFGLRLEIFSNAKTIHANTVWYFSVMDEREHEPALEAFCTYIRPLHPTALARYEFILRDTLQHQHELATLCGALYLGVVAFMVEMAPVSMLLILCISGNDSGLLILLLRLKISETSLVALKFAFFRSECGKM